MRTKFRHRSLLLPTLATLLPFLLSTYHANAEVTFDWVTVGNPGNLADTLVMNKGPSADGSTGYGAVDYEYRIAKTHVTNSQYAEFLNAVDPNGGNTNELYNANMTSSSIGGGTGIAYTGGIDFSDTATAGTKYSPKPGQENYPATWINWDSGARFANWLHNGQGDADTETGVYNMALRFRSRKREADSTFFIPSEDEFYKAAYYDPTKDGSGGYWQYAIQSDDPPISAAPPGEPGDEAISGNNRDPSEQYWQYGSFFDDSVDHLTDVGAYSEAESFYGLNDGDSLIYQWTEGTKPSFLGDELPVYRGGAWFYGQESSGAAHRNLYSFEDVASYHWFGLRIATVAEPGVSGDFNGDGAYDCFDINSLVGEITGGTNDGAFDLTRDGAVNGDDLEAWLVEGGANNPADTAGNPFVRGDANLDGMVNAADFNVWSENAFSDTSDWCRGDFNTDGHVDVSDFNIWNDQQSAAASAVPEPTGTVWIFLGVIAFTEARRRQIRESQ